MDINAIKLDEGFKISNISGCNNRKYMILSNMNELVDKVVDRNMNELATLEINTPIWYDKYLKKNYYIKQKENGVIDIYMLEKDVVINKFSYKILDDNSNDIHTFFSIKNFIFIMIDEDNNFKATWKLIDTEEGKVYSIKDMDFINPINLPYSIVQDGIINIILQRSYIEPVEAFELRNNPNITEEDMHLLENTIISIPLLKLITQIKMDHTKYEFKTLIDSNNGWVKIIGTQDNNLICLKSNNTCHSIIKINNNEEIDIIDIVDRIKNIYIFDNIYITVNRPNKMQIYSVDSQVNYCGDFSNKNNDIDFIYDKEFIFLKGNNHYSITSLTNNNETINVLADILVVNDKFIIG